MSHNLKSVCEQFTRMNFPNAEDKTHPRLEKVKLARSLIEQAIADESFVLDCISHELTLIEQRHFKPGLTPFFIDYTTGIQFSFGYWAPGASPGPHVHSAWTLTALCKNSLNVVTYNTEKALGHGVLEVEKDIDAKEGQVGFIHEPCVHNPSNKSSTWSWTLHVTSPRDGEDLPDLPNERFRFEQENMHSSTHPFSRVLSARQKHVRAQYLTSILRAFESDRAHDLLNRCARLGPRSLSIYRATKSLNLDTHDTSHSLEVTCDEIQMSCVGTSHTVTLTIDTPRGNMQLLTMDKLAKPALDFVANQQRFQISDLPGEISKEERFQIGEALETVGLFRSIT